MEGDNRNLGVYYNKIPAAGPDTDSVEIRLESQGLNVTPDLRLRHTRMIYQVPVTGSSSSEVAVTFNTPINWADCSLHTLLLDNSAGDLPVVFTFSIDWIFQDNNPTLSRKIRVDVGQRVYVYLSIISGKMYVNTAINSDPVIYV